VDRKEWKVYLSGEIHSDWRDEIRSKVNQADLPICFLSAVTDHDASDKCGDSILGPEENKFWKDHKAAKINTIRNKVLISEADIVVVRFGEKYKQWNAAFDAGMAVALGKPLIVQHHADNIHALKEVDAAAMVVAETIDQVIEILRYVVAGELKA